VRVADTEGEGVGGAHFVIASIRPGGAEGRARHQRIGLNHGVIDQGSPCSSFILNWSGSVIGRSQA
jgi:alpha-galactosidase/6-phospho-beta-glucosidase family protein